MTAATKPPKSTWKTPFMDVTITPEGTEDQIRQLVIQIRKTWSEDSVKLKKLTGGVLNLMYCCWNAELGQDVDAIVVRVHQRPPDMPENSNFDPKKEIDILEMVSSSGLGPDLIVIFNNGLCYNYLPGETLNVQSVRSEKFIPHVTELLARLHSTIPLMDRETAWTIKDIVEFIPEFPPTFKDPARLERLLKLLPDKEAFMKEVNHVTEAIENLDSPRVFCHNDSKGENFIWNEKTGTLRLIDFEHSGNNNQAFEIGSHFASYNDVLGNTPDTYPDRDFQLRWIRMYLQHWFKFTGKKASDVTERDVERLYVQANKYAQMTRLLIGVGLLQEQEGMFECYEFCMNFLDDYFKFKDQVDSMVLPD